MRLASLSTLLLAAVLAGPALWRGFVTRDLDYATALIRLLIAIPVAGVMLWILRSLTGASRRPKRRPPLRAQAVTGQPVARRRATDQPDAAGER